MLKGFLPIASAAALLAVLPNLQAQVYRCDGPSGTVFSDMPCGDSAEEIVLEGMERDSEASEGQQNMGPDEVPDQNQSYRNFLNVLNSQKQYNLGEVDRKLSSLRDTVAGSRFADMSEVDRKRLSDQVSDLELQREAIIAEYDGLIAEMESRIETEEDIVNVEDS